MDQQLPQAQGRAAGHQPEFLRAVLSHPDGGEAHQILSRRSVVDGSSESPIHSPSGSPIHSSSESPIHSSSESPIHSPSGSPFHSPSESPIHSGSEIHSQLTALEIA